MSEEKTVTEHQVYEEACALMQKAIDEARNRWRKQHQNGDYRGSKAYLRMVKYLEEELASWKSAYAKGFGK